MMRFMQQGVVELFTHVVPAFFFSCFHSFSVLKTDQCMIFRLNNVESSFKILKTKRQVRICIGIIYLNTANHKIQLKQTCFCMCDLHKRPKYQNLSAVHGNEEGIRDRQKESSQSPLRASIRLTEVPFSKLLNLCPLQACVMQQSLTFDLPVDIPVLVLSLVVRINRMSNLKCLRTTRGV